MNELIGKPSWFFAPFLSFVYKCTVCERWRCKLNGFINFFVELCKFKFKFEWLDKKMMK